MREREEEKWQVVLGGGWVGDDEKSGMRIYNEVAYGNGFHPSEQTRIIHQFNTQRKHERQKYEKKERKKERQHEIINQKGLVTGTGIGNLFIQNIPCISCY